MMLLRSLPLLLTVCCVSAKSCTARNASSSTLMQLARHEVTKNRSEDKSIYFMHMPKAAGWSFKVDFAKLLPGYLLLPKDFQASETDFCKSRNSNKRVVTLMRDPRAHVQSMYFYCKSSREYRTHGHPDLMPDRIDTWLETWIDSGPGNADALNKFCCYEPYNLQTRRLSCLAGVEAAKTHIDELFFVGLVELYHESLCVLTDKLTGRLPDFCACSPETRSEDSHISHGVKAHTVSDLSEVQRNMIDQLTRDDITLYDKARVRFLIDLKETEVRHNVSIRCPGRRRDQEVGEAVSLLSVSSENHERTNHCTYLPLNANK